MNWYLKGILACSSGLVVLAALLLTSGTASGLAQRKTSSSAKQADELFNRNCARCHGADGRGETPMGKVLKAPNLSDPDWWQQNPNLTSAKTLRSIVTRGKGAMPAFGKTLTRSEINLLVDRVRKFRKLEKARRADSQ